MPCKYLHIAKKTINGIALHLTDISQTGTLLQWLDLVHLHITKYQTCENNTQEIG